MSNPTGPVPPPLPPVVPTPPSSGIKTPVVLAIVGTVVGLLGLSTVCCCGLAFIGRGSRPVSQARQSVPSTPQVNLADLPSEKFVGAELLFSQYTGNQVASDSKYKNKTILVVGEVSTVEKAEIGDEMGIVFSCKHRFPGVRCYLTSAALASPELQEVEPGTWVKVEGNCEGLDFGGRVILRNSRFVVVKQ